MIQLGEWNLGSIFSPSCIIHSLFISYTKKTRIVCIERKCNARIIFFFSFFFLSLHSGHGGHKLLLPCLMVRVKWHQWRACNHKQQNIGLSQPFPLLSFYVSLLLRFFAFTFSSQWSNVHFIHKLVHVYYYFCFCVLSLSFSSPASVERVKCTLGPAKQSPAVVFTWVFTFISLSLPLCVRVRLHRNHSLFHMSREQPYIMKWK